MLSVHVDQRLLWYRPCRVTWAHSSISCVYPKVGTCFPRSCNQCETEYPGMKRYLTEILFLAESGMLSWGELQRWLGNAQGPPCVTSQTHPTPIPKKFRHAKVASRVSKLCNSSLTPKYRAKLIPNDLDASGNRLISQFCWHNDSDLVDTRKDHFHVKNKKSTMLCTLSNGKIGSKIWGLTGACFLLA